MPSDMMLPGQSSILYSKVINIPRFVEYK